MTKLHLLAGAALLSLAACQGADKSANNSQAPASNAASANAAAPAANSAGADDHGHNEDSPRVLLTANGVLSDGTDVGEIRFGAPQADTIRAVSRTLGDPTRTNAVEDCGGSGPAQAADYGPLVLFFQGGTFIGWEQRDRSENPYIGTPGGVNVGSRRPDLDAALGGAPSVERTSLGTEFDREGIYGLLASDRADAQVDRLWGGNNCAMR